MSSNISLLCVDEFWNTSISWSTNQPKLTRCLAQVGVNIIPNVIFCLLICIEMVLIFKWPNKLIRINKFNVTRFLICLFAIISNLILVASYGYSIAFIDLNPFTIVDLSAALSKLFVTVGLIVVFHYHRVYGIISSGTLFLILLLLSITSGIQFLDSTTYNADMYLDFEKKNASRLFLCIISLLILSCFADDPVDAGLKEKEDKKNLIDNIYIDHEDNDEDARIPQSAKQYSSFLSRITFYWYTKFVKKAAKREIQLNDIWQLEDHLKIDNASNIFEKEYNKELKKIENKNRESDQKVKLNSWRLVKVIFRTYGLEISFFSFIKFVFDILNFVSPVLLSAMIRYVADDDCHRWHGYLIVIGFLVVSFLKNILINKYFERGIGLGLKLKSVFNNIIFSKALKLSSRGKKSRTTGEIVNLISTDTQRFCDLAPFIAFVWSSPLQIIIGIFLLYQQMGSATFAGVLVIVFMLVTNAILMYFQKKFYLKEMKVKDERIKKITEVLSGIRIIKMYAWERAFLDNIRKEREKEIKYNKTTLFIDLVSYVFFSIGPTLVLVSTITVYIFTDVGTAFTAEKAFVSISLFNILQFSLEILPVILTYLTMSKVSLDRISSFLSEDELETYVNRKFDGKMALKIENRARFSWGDITEKDISKNKSEKNHKNDAKNNVKFELDKNQDKITFEQMTNNSTEIKSFELKDIEMNVPKNSFVAIIGSVGSGKSSLISAILGEMHLMDNEDGTRGQITMSEEQEFSYVAQTAWIQNDSLRGNILFGKQFNEVLYKEIISACALEPDLKQLEAGDQTEIGEKGINLSGGQKQRVSLARACYSSLSVGDGKQIVLLDDPLSAVDAHVSKHLCDNVLNSKNGILKNTTRVLVTNQLNQLGDLNVDQIILMKDGRIVLKCTYEELMELERDGKLSEYDLNLTENGSGDQSEEGKSEKSESRPLEPDEDSVKKIKIVTEEKKSFENKKLIEKERTEKGRVSLKNYQIYLRYFGYGYAIFTVLFLIGDNVFSVWSRDYLATWTKTEFETDDLDEIKKFNRIQILNYIYISIFQCIFTFLGNLLVVIGIISTIKLFHANLLYKIMRSPQEFFDTTPLGRIVNRFSKDIEAIDRALPRAVREFLLCFLNMIASISIILVKQPSSFLFYFLIFVVYYFVLDLYVNSSRQLKRYEGTTRSPIFSHFQETINGTSTIRAFNRVKDFEKQSRFKIDTNNRVSWYSFQGNRWLSFYLELLGGVILMVISVQLVIMKDQTNSGEVGLLISYALNITQFLTFVVRFYSMFEANAVSIERINEYCENKEEDEWEKDFKPDPDWPQKGVIEFKDYSARYREGTKLVLKNLNFKVDSEEKIGIVGRTGAGKSTITLSLFRIIEPAQGKIVIDNIDINQIGLHDLRSKISIIPQDPVLFQSSIRFNLDPFNKHSDEEIYRSLEHAHLKNYVNSLSDGIHHEISEGGDNLSVGQRQLICLARALLRKSKILVLDEATASVDFSTDELVQNTIRTEFKNCTTLTIAHRLKTVIDSSKILVLDNGELEEYDQPNKLLENPNSLFYLLAAKANLI